MPNSNYCDEAFKITEDLQLPNNKPIIFFDPAMSQQPELGKRCHVYTTTTHPKISWTNYIITSLVKYIYKDGSFRTMNSMYKPEPSHNE